jgi:thioesterase domain-containing protein
MAYLLDARKVPPTWRSLVPIQTAGGFPPLFLVPGIGGNVLGFAEVAAALAPEHPVYGFQSLGLDGVQAPLDRIEDIAAHFVKEMLTVQPNGPYRLAGACMGGIVAYEMAQQLRLAGAEVQFLSLIETWPPPANRHEPSRLRWFTSRSAAAAEGAEPLDVSTEPEPAARGLSWPVAKLMKLLRVLAGREPLRDLAHAARERVKDANYRAFVRYRPQPYDGLITLVLAHDRAVPEGHDVRLYWQTVARDSVVYRLPGKDSGLLLRGATARELARFLAAPVLRPITLAVAALVCS